MLISSLSPGIFIIIATLVCCLFPKKIRNYAVVLVSVWNLLQVVWLKEGMTVDFDFLPDMKINLLTVDRLSWIFGFVFSILWVVGAIYSIYSDKREELIATGLYVGSTIGIVFAGSLITVVFFWELMAVASMCVILMGGTELSRKAGFRYLIAHFLGGNLLLAGVVMKVASGYTEVASFVDGPHDISFWLILAGVLLNAAMPPFHAWITDSYPEATIGGAVFLCGCTTKVAVYCLIRMFPGTNVLVAIGVFAAIFGVIYAIFENDMRRLLSYHIISQVGFMTASAGLGTPLGLDGAASLAFTHVIYKSLLFMCTGAVIYATGKRKITELGGLYKKMPFEMICLFIASLSISGVPFFSGCTSKSMILAASAEAGNAWMELLLTLAGIGTFLSITLKMTYFIFFGKEDAATGEKGAETSIIRRIPLSMKVAMGIQALLCICYGIFPDLLFNMLPGNSVTPLYNFDHLTEYGEMLSLALIVFVIFLPKMKPHEKLSLDLDWFYRKPVFRLMKLSEAVCYLGDKTGELITKGIIGLVTISRNPFFFTKSSGRSTYSTSNRKMRSFEPDAYRISVGTLIIINLGVLSLLLVILFAFVL